MINENILVYIPEMCRYGSVIRQGLTFRIMIVIGALSLCLYNTLGSFFLCVGVTKIGGCSPMPHTCTLYHMDENKVPELSQSSKQNLEIQSCSIELNHMSTPASIIVTRVMRCSASLILHHLFYPWSNDGHNFARALKSPKENWELLKRRRKERKLHSNQQVSSCPLLYCYYKGTWIISRCFM